MNIQHLGELGLGQSYELSFFVQKYLFCLHCTLAHSFSKLVTASRWAVFIGGGRGTPQVRFPSPPNQFSQNSATSLVFFRHPLVSFLPPILFPYLIFFNIHLFSSPKKKSCITSRRPSSHKKGTKWFHLIYLCIQIQQNLYD